LFEPGDFCNTTFNINGPSYTIKGVELQLVARVTEGLTVQDRVLEQLEQTNAPCLRVTGRAARPRSVSASRKSRPALHQSVRWCRHVARGSHRPHVQPAGALRVEFARLQPFAWVGASHIAAMRNEAGKLPQTAMIRHRTSDHDAAALHDTRIHT